MSEQARRAMWPEMMAMHGETAELIIERETIQEGRSFSPEGMEGLHDQMIVWVGTRLMRRWDATNEPPTLLRVTITVEAS